LPLLLGFLKGVFEKRGVLTWFFGGEFVVDCVVNVDKKTALLGV
jgi:hypothetical protein